MDNDLLGKVIAAEKDIASNLESEKRKICAWLEDESREIAATFAREEEEAKRSHARAVAEAEAEAERTASGIVSAAGVRAEFIKGLDDRLLRDVVLRHIRQILPDKGHDSSNVQD